MTGRRPRLWVRFPKAFWRAMLALPLPAVNDAMRGIFRSEPLVTAILSELGVVTARGLVAFAITGRRFRRQ